jgi:hypothetical protein
MGRRIGGGQAQQDGIRTVARGRAVVPLTCHSQGQQAVNSGNVRSVRPPGQSLRPPCIRLLTSEGSPAPCGPPRSAGISHPRCAPKTRLAREGRSSAACLARSVNRRLRQEPQVTIRIRKQICKRDAAEQAETRETWPTPGDRPASHLPRPARRIEITRDGRDEGHTAHNPAMAGCSASGGGASAPGRMQRFGYVTVLGG